ncbi:MAG: UDP-2,3-diacylglucosamine diphosphatase [Thiohalocapsa sp.]|uniref:UDP-2,3-diacylglucosamine diphosphatase n=1 Tax=Thiohalocapsa sp. TaxID=2497641 RepID=UPI0025FE7CA1|nr:UDP-2,3-diacylglucosamine diphosphatase [Thiohalocapsa sp.]MCG6941722.1 UDP-2,3-diacylglucosamine diphosphatase [Thiohalocapsa sp.]
MPQPPSAAAAPASGRTGAQRAGDTLFISDLHLSPQQPDLTALFLHWLGTRPRGAAALYILGDLFDTWIGDDDDGYRDIEAALAEVAAAGTRCQLMHGNRDFLLGRRFARRTGVTLLRDPARITLAGEPMLLMHGDLLCTDDVPYQRFRRRVRNPLVQWLFLRQSLRRRRRIAANYRQQSARAMADKTAEIMDVNADTVLRYMRRHGVRRLIHGHTHRPADHPLRLDGAPAHRHVLADWSAAGGEVLVAAGGELIREPVRPPGAGAS